jgi:hypothetical protein
MAVMLGLRIAGQPGSFRSVTSEPGCGVPLLWQKRIEFSEF